MALSIHAAARSVVVVASARTHKLALQPPPERVSPQTERASTCPTLSLTSDVLVRARAFVDAMSDRNSIAVRCARMSAELDARTSLLRQELERLSKLSSRSTYVRSRSAVIQRALELLAAASRSAEQDDELTRLLSGLAL